MFVSWNAAEIVTLTEEGKADKQLWNALMIIAHIVTEPLCKLLYEQKKKNIYKAKGGSSEDTQLWGNTKRCFWKRRPEGP